MATPYPGREVYEDLYAKYLLTPADTLLKISGLKPKETLLDLCCGNLRMSHAALDMGAIVVTAVDAQQAMMDGRWDRDGLRTIISTVERYLDRIIDGAWSPGGAALHHVIACQQAVNIWLSQDTAAKVSKHLIEDGRFVFNTFNTKPSEKPQIQEYWLPPNRKFAELVYCIGNVVHHVQAGEGYEPHHSSFRWISKDEFAAWLCPHFNVEVMTKNKTDYYLCRKK